MVYTEISEYARTPVPGGMLNRPIWAFAYSIDNENNTSRLRSTPTLGEIHADGWQKRFIPYRKDGQTLAPSRSVLYSSRFYADTEEEAIKAYNALVQARIDRLAWLMAETEQDFLSPGAEPPKRNITMLRLDIRRLNPETIRRLYMAAANETSIYLDIDIHVFTAPHILRDYDPTPVKPDVHPAVCVEFSQFHVPDTPEDMPAELYACIKYTATNGYKAIQFADITDYIYDNGLPVPRKPVQKA